MDFDSFEPMTTYFWKVVAFDDHDNSTEGPVWIFSTGANGTPCPGTPTVTDIDGNFYNTVLIGDQCWMAENLNTTKDAAGNSIDRYCYDNNSDNCDAYGSLYTWATVMNGSASSNSNPSGVQGICPAGWHVPSRSEWTQLVNYVVAQGYPNSSSNPDGTGNALKSCQQVNSPFGDLCNITEHPRWNSHGTHHGFDDFGFSALPGGRRLVDSNYDRFGGYGYWWSSAQSSTNNAWNRIMFSSLGNVGPYELNKSYGFSLRCVKTPVNLPTVITLPTSDITPSSAIVGGSVSDTGGSVVTERGIYWSINPSPHLVGTPIALGVGFCEFFTALDPLSTGTTYYYVAYANNIMGTAFGEVMSFTTLIIPPIPIGEPNNNNRDDKESNIFK
jgi:uncharacterized protein (TIGR02145 family)